LRIHKQLKSEPRYNPPFEKWFGDKYTIVRIKLPSEKGDEDVQETYHANKYQEFFPKEVGDMSVEGMSRMKTIVTIPWYWFLGLLGKLIPFRRFAFWPI
jgi:hypothetical protein